MRQIHMTFRLPETMLEEIDALAARRGHKRSDTIREAIAVGIAAINAGAVSAHGGNPAASGGENPSPRSSSTR